MGAAEAREVQSSWFTLQEGLTKSILVVGGKGRSARTLGALLDAAENGWVQEEGAVFSYRYCW